MWSFSLRRRSPRPDGRRCGALQRQGQAAVARAGGPPFLRMPLRMPDQVPTWNYVALHLRGTLREVPIETLREHADALSARFEADLLPKKPWNSAKMAEGVMDRMMRMIIPFRMDIEAVDGTWKLNQNKEPAVRLAAAKALAAQPSEGAAQALAGLMRTAE